MRFLLLLSWAILISPPGFSQRESWNERFAQVDAHVARVSRQIIGHPDVLVDSLTAPFTNDYDKVRAIYVWIATNIQYDLLSFHQSRSQGQTVSKVLSSGKALCSGFSLLFQDFCHKANIESEIIEGYAKAIGYKPGQKFESSNHAWNAVRIYGTWYLLDVTWAAGNPQFLSGQKNKTDLDTYFLVNPEILVKTHLPEDPSWQLISDKRSLREFETGKSEDVKDGAINAYAPEDYDGMHEFDLDILKYKRAKAFNPRNINLADRLSFAYLFKGISITEDIWKFEYKDLCDSAAGLESAFYAYMDSAWMAIEGVNAIVMQSSRRIIADEINYQKGVFNYEMATEMFNKAYKKKIPLTKIDNRYRKHFEVAEQHFIAVTATSIYQSDARKYLGLITDYKAQMN